MARVKGLAFRSVLRAHQALRGEASLERVFGYLPPELGARYRFVLATNWYGIEDYVALWKAIERVVGKGPDYPRLIGRHCVEQDLSLVHKLAMAALSASTVLDIAARMFRYYYDTGRATAKRVSDHEVEVRFEGCEGFSSAMWFEICGSMEAYAERASGKRARTMILEGGGDEPQALVEVSWPSG